MADRTYGSMSPEQMTAQVDSILRKVNSELEKADDKHEWWDGFCDRGEEIWLERIDQINSAMGLKVYNPGTDKKHNRYAIRQQCADGRRAGQDARVIAGRV